MKVKLRKPVHWFGPYQLAEALCFWAPKVKDACGFDREADWVHDFGTFLAGGSKQDSLLSRFLQWLHKVRQNLPWNKDVVKIDYWDSWSCDHTLSPIILPLLKQLKATKHGYGMIEDVDVPKHLQSWYALPKETWEWDGNAEARYEWVLDEMIWSFEQLCNDDHDSQFFDHSGVDMNLPFMEQIGKTKIDHLGLKAHNERIDNGLRLFGKYFRTLWD